MKLEWVSVKDSLPEYNELENKTIVVLINNQSCLCDVCNDNSGGLYILSDSLYYQRTEGFFGDKRFAKPTHWMELPKLPEEKS